MQVGKILKWRLSNFKNVNLWLKNSGSLSNSVGEENLWFLTFDLKHIDLLDEGCKYMMVAMNLVKKIADAIRF